MGVLIVSLVIEVCKIKNFRYYKYLNDGGVKILRVTIMVNPLLSFSTVISFAYTSLTVQISVLVVALFTNSYIH